MTFFGPEDPRDGLTLLGKCEPWVTPTRGRGWRSAGWQPHLTPGGQVSHSDRWIHWAPGYDDWSPSDGFWLVDQRNGEIWGGPQLLAKFQAQATGLQRFAAAAGARPAQVRDGLLAVILAVACLYSLGLLGLVFSLWLLLLLLLAAIIAVLLGVAWWMAGLFAAWMVVQAARDSR